MIVLNFRQFYETHYKIREEKKESDDK